MDPKLTSSIKRTTIYTLIFLLNIHILRSNDTASVSLFDMSIEELINQEVTIATKSSQKLTQSPAVVSVISSDQIKAYGLRDLYEVLSIIPGFEYSQLMPGTRIISIRGVVDIKQGGRFLVLMDGMPYNGILYGTSLYYGYELNIDAIERIEIIRGPGSALYGRNAFQSVINIITKKAVKDKKINLVTSLGSYNSGELYADYSIKKEKFNAFLSAKYLTTDGTNSKFNNGMGGEDVWNLKQDNIYVYGNAQYKGLQIYTSFNSRNVGNSAPQLFLTNSSTVFNNGTYNLIYSKNISSKISFSAKTFGRFEHRTQDIETLRPGITDTVYVAGIGRYVPYSMIYPKGLYAFVTHDDYTYGAEAEFNFKLLRNNNLMVGLQTDIHGVGNASALINYTPTAIPSPIDPATNFYYSRDSLVEVSEWIKDGGHRYKNLAIYAQNIHYFTDKLGITLGARFDLDSEIGSIVNPRLGMVWEILPFLSFKALYGEAYRAPTTSEQYKVFGYDQGNTNLNYEEIKTTEFVFTFKTSNLISNLSYYNSDLKNIIQIQKDTLGNISYLNTGRNKSQGVEMENKLIISKSLQLFLNFNYKISYDIRDGKEIQHPNMSKFISVLGLNYKVLPKIKYSGYLLYNSLTEKYPNPYYPLAEEKYISLDKVGDYFLLNSSIQFNNIVKGLDITLYGYNLLNSKYFFQDNLNTHQPAQPGTNFTIKVNYYFN